MQEGSGESGNESDDEGEAGALAAARRAALRESKAAAAKRGSWLKPTPTTLMFVLIGLVLLAQARFGVRTHNLSEFHFFIRHP